MICSWCGSSNVTRGNLADHGVTKAVLKCSACDRFTPVDANAPGGPAAAPRRSTRAVPLMIVGGALVIAVVVLVVAWSLGLFSSGSGTTAGNETSPQRG